MNKLIKTGQSMALLTQFIPDYPQGITKHDSLQPETKLYRYINLSQFLSWIETRQTYLKRVTAWDDPKEIPIRQRFMDKHPDNGGIVFSNLFGQCWSQNPDSDALWRIYSQNNEGLMIETSVAKFDLIEGLSFGLLSPVEYGVFNDTQDNICKFLPSPIDQYTLLSTTALFKRKAFEHEQEVRLLGLNPGSFQNPVTDDSVCKLLPLNPIKYIEGITIDPRASDWYVDTIKSFCKRYRLTCVPVKSSLYAH